MASTGIKFVCVVSYALGGRVFSESGEKGSLDKQLAGFVTGVVNKRSEVKGSFNQGENSFSYMKSADQSFAFVVIASTEVVSDVIWGFLQELIKRAPNTQEKTAFVPVMDGLLELYKGVVTKEDLLRVKKIEAQSAKAAVPENPLEPLSKFVEIVGKKVSQQNPSKDPISHFFDCLGESYTEIGGNETMTKVMNDVGQVTAFKFEEIGQDIEAAGGGKAYIEKEVIGQKVVPAALFLQETGNKAVVQITASVDELGKEVAAKGGLEPFLKEKSENAVAVTLEVGGAVVAGCAQLGDDIKTKGFQEAVTETFTKLATASAQKENSAGSGFDEESF